MEKSAGNGDAKVQATAMSLTRHDLIELKSLANPPQGVKDVLEAVQFLLGRPVHVATDFKKAKALLAGVGENSLVHLIQARDVQLVDSATASRAREILKPHTENSIRNKSMACVALYRWVNAVIEAVEARGES